MKCPVAAIRTQPKTTAGAPTEDSSPKYDRQYRCRQQQCADSVGLAGRVTFAALAPLTQMLEHCGSHSREGRKDRMNRKKYGSKRGPRPERVCVSQDYTTKAEPTVMNVAVQTRRRRIAIQKTPNQNQYVGIRIIGSALACRWSVRVLHRSP